MTLTPWEEMRSLRVGMGATQADFSRGIVAQSTLSQIECGRLLPSHKQLIQFAGKLGLPPTYLVERWAEFRTASEVRLKLYQAATRQDEIHLAHVLDEASSVLTEFETNIYNALLQTLQGNLLAAEGLLNSAWTHKVRSNGVKPGAAVYRVVDQRRTMEVEALVRVLNYRASGRLVAAEVWLEKQRRRKQALRTTLGQG